MTTTKAIKQQQQSHLWATVRRSSTRNNWKSSRSSSSSLSVFLLKTFFYFSVLLWQYLTLIIYHPPLPHFQSSSLKQHLFLLLFHILNDLFQFRWVQPILNIHPIFLLTHFVHIMIITIILYYTRGLCAFIYDLISRF